MEKLKLELSLKTLETIKKYLIESYAFADEPLRLAIYEYTQSMPTNYNLKNV